LPSVIVTEIGKVPDVVGVPDSNPGLERTRPSSDPDSVHVNVPVPPVPVNCCDEYGVPSVPPFKLVVVMAKGQTWFPYPYAKVPPLPYP
jgi:hypothetical protein